MKGFSRIATSQPSPQQVRSWINRQRTLAEPNQTYIRWLRKNFRVTAEATVIKKEK
jgi:hypothetical protein